MRRILFTALFLGLMYFSISQGYMKVWFVILWGVIAIIAVFRMEPKSWWEPAPLRLNPALQFVLTLILVIGAIVATDWSSLGQRDFNQAVYTFWTLTLYRQGLKWAYLHVKRKR